MATYLFRKTITFYTTVEAQTLEEAEAMVEDVNTLVDDVDSDEESGWEVVIID